ncbi:MAG: transglutaminase TgpA family protein [Anaerolineales bacterium]
MTHRIRFFRLSWSSTVALILTLTLAGITADNITRARWTANPDVHLPAVWLGLLCGATLALTRWRGRTALAYSFGLSLVVAFETIARVMTSPALVAPTLRQAIDGLHLRAVTGWERVSEWPATLAAGEAVPDTGLFIALLGIIVWSALAWLGWWLARRQQPLIAVLPLAALLALNNHLSGQPSAGFIALLACTLLLIAGVGFGQLQRDWDARRVDYSEELGLECGAAGVVLTMVIGLAVAAAPFAATPEGWRAMAKVLEGPAAQTASQLFSGVNPPRDVSFATFAQTPDLSRIGAPIPQSDETVMWVRISDAPPLPPQVGEAARVTTRVHYWRNAVFGAYTGQGWRASADVDSLVGDAGRYPLQQHFEIVADHSPALFAVNRPITTNVSITPNGLVQGEVSSYTVTSLATRVTATELITTSIEYPAEIAREYLPLPETVPARVQALAARLTAGTANAYDKAVQIQNYLRANYPYRLDAPPAPAGRDAVDYFLFEGPGGFCSHYASAMVVLLRAVDVPARVVTGFAMGAYDFERGAWRVPASAAHAWVEVYFPEYGWVEFEPTAAFSPRDYPGAASAAPAEPAAVPSHQPITAWEVVRLVGAVVVVIAILVWLVRPLFIRAQPTPERARRLYWQMRAALGRAGLRGNPSTTPHEYLNAHAEALAPPLRSALADVTRVYERAEYGEQTPAPREVENVQHQWQRARGEWMKLWWRRMTSPPA